MPDPFERHARPNGYGDDWGPRPPRSQQRTAAATEQLHPEIIPEGKRPPGKKDPDLCKAAHWKGPHRPEIRVRAGGWLGGRQECGWGVSWRGGETRHAYFCRHEEVCGGCQKTLRGGRIPASECPLFHAITTEEHAQVEAEIERREARGARRAIRRKPPVTGPQGYRRPKPTRT
jgi:hypothetical protein